MRLALFALIDRTLALRGVRESAYHSAVFRLQEDFTQICAPCAENIASFQSRLKSEASLREKIIRKEIYKQYETPEDILQNLSDLIGLRIECRFIREENIIYKTLREAFTVPCASGWFRHAEYPHLMMDFSSEQPQRQANGHTIYRIDGILDWDGMQIRFELQIKSLVNTFWGEVEHQIIYKNNTYMLLDTFMTEMLNSIYESLAMIDRQLSVLYDQVQQQQTGGSALRDETLMALTAKDISDIFTLKMKSSLGFTLNINRSCDIISLFIVEMLTKTTPADIPVFRQLFHYVNEVTNTEIGFEEPLALDWQPEESDAFGTILGGYLKETINIDYDWNLFFRMVFQLAHRDNAESFALFLRMLREKFSQPKLYVPLYLIWDEAHTKRFREELLVEIARAMVCDGTIRIIYKPTMESILARIEDITLFLSCSDAPENDWRMNKYELLYGILGE